MPDLDFVFHFNKIIVIESLREKEMKTGRNLYDSIITKFPLKAEYFTTDFKSVNSKKQFFTALSEIAQTVQTRSLSLYPL